MARSPMVTMPAGRPSWTTGIRRTLFSRTRRIASSTVWSTVSVLSWLLQTSATFVACGSAPSATARTAMSRSVTIPVTLPPSTTSTAPMSASRIACAASVSVADDSTVRGSAVMTSRMLWAMEVPPCRGDRGRRYPPRRRPFAWVVPQRTTGRAWGADAPCRWSSRDRDSAGIRPAAPAPSLAQTGQLTELVDGVRHEAGDLVADAGGQSDQRGDHQDDDGHDAEPLDERLPAL